jgi:tetratricopeptide (TPR) repeat protein
VSGLIERSAELSALDEVLAGAEAGTGQTLVVSGPAGVGKSSLVAHAREVAGGRGFTVLHSCPTPVSATLAHAVVRDWVGPLARRHAGGGTPFDGPAAILAGALSETGLDHQTWTLDTLDYALGWLFENLCETGPLLLAVDDVQWADTGSLQVLDLLSARLHGSPIVLMLGRRTGESVVRTDLLERITGRAQVLLPEPLSVIGVEQLRQQLPDGTNVNRVSAQELHRLTGGLPFLVRELLRSGRLSAPPSVVESVRERLGRLGEPTLEIARTVAVLGEEATFDALGELCGLTVAELADPLEVLTDADIVTLGLWRAWPAHPIVSEAILATMTPSERSDQHRRAAKHLAKLDRPRQVIASHLVHTLPDEDLAVVDLLRAAAEESLESGAPQVAAAQLLRAVGETRPDDTEPSLVRAAAAAHMRAGMAEDALALWHRALERMTRPEEQALCLADIGDAQITIGDRDTARVSYARAGDLLTGAGHDSSSQAMRLLLARMGMARAMYDGAQVVMESAIADATVQPSECDTHADRLLFALRGLGLALEGRDHRTARDLALRAVAGGKLLEEETSDGNGLYLAASVLSWTDAFDAALAVLDAAVEDSRRRGSPLGFAKASYVRGYAHYRKGNLRLAVTDLDAALAMRERGWHGATESALATLAYAHIGLGQLAEAQALEPELRRTAERTGIASAVALTAAGIIRACLGDHEQAVRDYRAAGAILAPAASGSAVLEWREVSVWSLLALGRRAEALTTAQEAVTAARRWGVPRTIGFALRTMSRAVPPHAALPLLREAVALFESSEAVDYLARAQIDLGALLIRSASGRAEGIALLQQALEYARRTDVPFLVGDATRVLTKHGISVTAPPDSPISLLTPGERRVVELAVLGHTNRKIAQELFVTVKAVEWHLSNAYRKLAISSRAQLPDALAGQRGADREPSSSSAR